MWYPTSRAALEQLRVSVTDARRRSSRQEVTELLSQIEREVAASPSTCLRFDEAGYATLHAIGRQYLAGRFETPSLGELRTRVQSKPRSASPTLRLVVLDGVDVLADVGALQATAPPGALFQVASQFNCLESPGSYVTPIAEYTHDPTQGPRASVSAFPGVFLRHYAAPSRDGGRFVQTNANGINLLADAFDKTLAEVESGYLVTAAMHRPEELLSTLTKYVERVRVGVHSGIEVVFGQDWGGPALTRGKRVSQVLTSTLALGGYSDRDNEIAQRICRQLLRASYLGTLLAALDLDSKAVVLTLIGGGVFGNEIPLIWDSILWAFSEVKSFAPCSLDVVVNGRTLSRSVPGAELEKAATERGGSYLQLQG